MKSPPSSASRTPRSTFWNVLRAPVTSFKASLRSAVSALSHSPPALRAAAAASAALFLSVLASSRKALPRPFRPTTAADLSNLPAGSLAAHPTRPLSLLPFSGKSNIKMENSPPDGTPEAHLTEPLSAQSTGASMDGTDTIPSIENMTEIAEIPQNATEHPPSNAVNDESAAADKTQEPDTIPSAGRADVDDEVEPYWATQEGFTGTRRFKLGDDCDLVLHRGDITKWAVDHTSDAIVNAANARMLGGGGVDGAIHRAAGPELLEMCRAAPQVERGVRCPTGSAVTTGGASLPVKFVIHTVGPIYDSVRDPAALLASSYRNSMQQAQAHGVNYICFPAISCGLYGYPLSEAAELSIQTLKDSCENIKEVHFVLFGNREMDAWLAASEDLLLPDS